MLENLVDEVGRLLKKTGKLPKELTREDFEENGIVSVFNVYDSVYAVLQLMGLANFEPWEMNGRVPRCYWQSKDNRCVATQWLMKKTGKKPEDLGVIDFRENGLDGLLSTFYNSSPYAALKEAGLADFEPWEMKRAPQGHYQEKSNRILATRWLVEKVKKFPKNISRKDFSDYRLRGLLALCDESPYLALKEAGLVDFEPWEMKNGVPKHYFDEKENRIRAINWLVKKTNKSPRHIIQKDFSDNSLDGLLHNHYHNSPKVALNAAGHIIEEKKQLKPAELLRMYVQN